MFALSMDDFACAKEILAKCVHAQCVHVNMSLSFPLKQPLPFLYQLIDRILLEE